MGDLDQAEASLLVAVNLNPGSGQYRWRLANLLLRQGNLDEAFEEIATAVDLEPQLVEPAVVLLLKSGVASDRVEGLLPEDRIASLRLMRTMLSLLNRPGSVPAVGAGYDSLLNTLWPRLLADPDPVTVVEGRAYVDRLLRSGHLPKARQAWLDLTRVNGAFDADFGEGSNLVWNGNFGSEPLGTPLGWRIDRSATFAAERALGQGRGNSSALKIEFLGTENLSFSHVSQQLILEPEAAYRLTAVLRSEELTTDQGVFIEVYSRDPNGRLVSTEPVLGSTDWTLFEAEFTMPEGSGLAMIRLRRLSSQQIDNRLRGKVFLDSVKIEQVSP